MELANAPFFFWILAGLLTFAAIGSALWPVMRRQNDETTIPEGNEGTKLILIDQLNEIKRDRERGLINEDEEESARAEVARRLLKLERETVPASNVITRGKREVYPWVMIVLIPLASVGFYFLSATPQQADLRIAANTNETRPDDQAADPPSNQQDIATLVARVEAHLVNNPNDIRGWQTIAPVYQRQGKLDKAEEAFRKALALGGEDKSATGRMQNGLGQVLALKAEGQVSDEALALFRQAQINEPRDATGFFFEALALSQAERRTEAISAWERLIAGFGQGNPRWLGVAQQTLAVLKAEAAKESSPIPEKPKGPSAEEVEEARNLSEEDRNVLIESMVSGLAARLDENPENLTGWLQLIRSYIVLDRKSEAIGALEKARSTFKNNQQSLLALDKIAQENNL